MPLGVDDLTDSAIDQAIKCRLSHGKCLKFASKFCAHFIIRTD